MMHATLQALYLVEKPEEGSRPFGRAAIENRVVIELGVDDASGKHIRLPPLHLHRLVAPNTEIPQTIGGILSVSF